MALVGLHGAWFGVAREVRRVHGQPKLVAGFVLSWFCDVKKPQLYYCSRIGADIRYMFAFEMATSFDLKRACFPSSFYFLRVVCLKYFCLLIRAIPSPPLRYRLRVGVEGPRL